MPEKVIFPHCHAQVTGKTTVRCQQRSMLSKYYVFGWTSWSTFTGWPKPSQSYSHSCSLAETLLAETKTMPKLKFTCIFGTEIVSKIWPVSTDLISRMLGVTTWPD